MDIKNLTANEVSIIIELLEKRITESIWVFEKEELETLLVKVQKAS